MKYIADIREGDSIREHYFCKEKQHMLSRAGKNYLSLQLSDKTGVLSGKVWELNNNIENFEAGEFIKIEGLVLNYQGELQIKIVRIRRSAEGEYLPSDYVPTSGGDVDKMYAELTGFISKISNAFIKKLLENIFINDPLIPERFKSSTAAKSFHHNFVGGLLEHTLSVTRLCDFVSGQYNHVNRDILVAAAMLHDIGKIWELSGFPENEYTDSGQLLGHIYMGTELIAREAEKIPGFPDNLTLLLKHCVLAHHGDFEFGSPKLPSVIEAFILYNCDNMDAKVFSFIESIDKDKSNNKWVGFNRMLGRNIRRTE
ncbi:MAG: HD domain-containing protein [Clostridiales bacterium]|jgi:3'-5' exoribonuclease|nr:HD domain-containing protein [Clostridiales bacterium]